MSTEPEDLRAENTCRTLTLAEVSELTAHAHTPAIIMTPASRATWILPTAVRDRNCRLRSGRAASYISYS